MPERIQRQRTKGWKMPEGAVYVGRPGLFGNPFAVGDPITKEPFRSVFGDKVTDHGHAVDLFTTYAGVTSGYDLLVVRDLAGKDLACWCPLDQPCHADVLLAIANAPQPDLEQEAGTPA